MEAFLVSVLAVAIGEIGDKTQLLALLLAVRFRRPWPIVAGIFVATIANHALAALLGQWVAAHIPVTMLRWMLGLSFLAIALWALKPDEMESEAVEQGHYGVFILTCITFFLAEIGDKTQLATVALAARYQELIPVLAGTTMGMLLADAPAVFLGRIAAGIFAMLGVVVLAGVPLAF